METKSEQDTLDLEQTLKYAEEFSELYHSEKVKRKALEIANTQLREFSLNLENAYQNINNAYLSALKCLSLAAEYKDGETGNHINRMSGYSVILATKYGCDKETVENIKYASPMHDIGKVGVPDYILQKPDVLSREEFKIIQQHTIIGENILKGLKSPLADLAGKIAVSHHEKWDGTGYPYNAKGENIPLEGRIVAIADVFDALTSSRPYKQPYSTQKAFELIVNDRGIGFDPELVDVFEECFEDFKSLKKSVDGENHKETEDFQLSARDN